MYLLITNTYPENNNLYANAFIHRRVIHYKKNNLPIIVFVCRPDNVESRKEYTFEDVHIYVGNREDLRKYINNNKFQKILIHMINNEIVKALSGLNSLPKIILWLHGSEGEKWNRRLFNYEFSDVKGIYFFLKNTLMLIRWNRILKKFLDRNREIITIVTVSNWFKNVLHKDLNLKNIECIVIPNLIDGSLFKYEEKDISQRYKFLSIRPFASKVYGNDISVRIIKLLSIHEEFRNMEFVFVGEGDLYDTISKELKEFENVTFRNESISQNEIAQLHRNYGFFLSPARWDTHGVSRCEAMSSGLIPITSSVAAIPEYVKKDIDGIISNDTNEICNAIIKIVRNPNLFKEMSFNAAYSMRKTCSTEHTVIKEIDIIKNA